LLYSFVLPFLLAILSFVILSRLKNYYGFSLCRVGTEVNKGW